MRLKIDLYRRLARVASQQELDELAAELVDRFGARPPEVERMLSRAQLRLLAHRWQISSIHLEDGFAVLAYTDRRKIEQLGQAIGPAAADCGWRRARMCHWRKGLKRPTNSWRC